MSGKILTVGVLAFCAGILVVVLVKSTSLAVATPAAESAGPYSVVASSDAFVLIDARNGKSWILHPREGEVGAAWLPIKRLASESEIRSWKLRKQIME